MLRGTTMEREYEEPEPLERHTVSLRSWQCDALYSVTEAIRCLET